MNEVSVQNQNGIMKTNVPTQEVIPGDILVPRLLLMQGQSDLVAAQKAKTGDWVKDITAQVLGGPGKQISFVPLLVKNFWRPEHQAPGAKRFNWKPKYPRTPLNDSLPWTFQADQDGHELRDLGGQKVVTDYQGIQVGKSAKDWKPFGEWKRTKEIEVLAILPDEIDAFDEELKKAAKGELPDLSKALTPLLISFRSTGFKAGKVVSDHFLRAAGYNQPGWRYQLELGCVMQSNDDGTFYVPVVLGPAKPVKKEHLKQVEYWASVTTSKFETLKFSDEDDVPMQSAPSDLC